jgi:hypothetical protein
MRCLNWGAALGLVAWGGLAAALAADFPAGPTSKPVCRSHGTSVEFLNTPTEAAGRALRDQKLVFVLHVSGHFEDPQFT